MGADLYLNSIWEPWIETHKSILLNPNRRPEIETVDDLARAAGDIFDSYRASGGYFRNGYNSGDVMWAMGLSWRGDVGEILDSEHRLSIDHARALIAKIEARPLTRERIAQHIFEHMTSGVLDHPVSGQTQKLLDAAVGETRPLAPPNIDVMSTFLCKRRDELLTILRKSVELREPLLCWL
jgi:hypothetical protein